MAQQTNPLGIWYPTSITLIINKIKYKGYPVPMSLLAINLEQCRLYDLQNKK